MTHCRLLPLCLAAAIHACAPVDAEIETADPNPTLDSGAVSTCAPSLTAAGASASVAQDGNPAAQAIDGNLTTRWSGYGVGANVTLDLGAAKSLCGVSVAWYNGAARRNTFTLSFSTDGATFTQGYAGTSSGTTAGFEPYALSPRTARYVRLTVNGNTQNDWASVSEISVQGSAPATTTAFRHPGVLLSREQLDFVKNKIAARAEPWTSNLTFLQTRSRANDGQIYGSLAYTPHPVARVECRSTGVLSGGVCTYPTDDAIAAYAHALNWYYTGNRASAQKSIQIMNAWSAVLTEIAFDRTEFTQGIELAAWGGQIWPRAAEIMRYTFTPQAGETAFDATRFRTMLNRAYLPLVINGWTGGGANPLMSMAEATIAIGVYSDDRATFDNGINDWRTQLRSMLYLTSDGPLPPVPPGTVITDVVKYWRYPGRFVDGLEGETCRDMSHMLMGLDAVVFAAETARIQGVDLLSEHRARLVAGYEFNAGVLAQFLSTGAGPDWLCGGVIHDGGIGYKLGWETAYNALANRLGASMPNTRNIIMNVVRPSSYKANGYMDWETLTHAFN